MRQKAFRVGNSLVVTLPKNFVEEENIKAGDEVDFDPKPANKKSSLTPEFQKWVENYIEKNRPALEELANK